MAITFQTEDLGTWDATYENHKIIEKKYLSAVATEDQENPPSYAVINYSYNDDGTLKSATCSELLLGFQCVYDDQGRLIKQYCPAYYDTNTSSAVEKENPLTDVKGYFPTLMTEFDVIYDDRNQPFYLDPFHTRILPIGNSKLYDKDNKNVAFDVSILGEVNNAIMEVIPNKEGYVFKDNKPYIKVTKTGFIFYKDGENYDSSSLSYSDIMKDTYEYDLENGICTQTTYKCVATTASVGFGSPIVFYPTMYVDCVYKTKLIDGEYREISNRDYDETGSVFWDGSWDVEWGHDEEGNTVTVKETRYDSEGAAYINFGIEKTTDDKGRIIESKFYNNNDTPDYTSSKTFKKTFTDNEDGSYTILTRFTTNGTSNRFLTALSNLSTNELSNSYMDASDINAFSDNESTKLQSLSNNLSNAIATDKIFDILKYVEIPYINESKYDKNGNILYIHVFTNSTKELLHEACVDITRDNNGNIMEIKYYNSDGTINSKCSRRYTYTDNGKIEKMLFINNNDEVVWTGSYEYIYDLEGLSGFDGCKRYMYDNTHYIFNLSEANYTSDTIAKKRYFNIDGSICWTVSYDIENGKTYRFDPEGNKFRFDIIDEKFITDDGIVDLPLSDEMKLSNKAESLAVSAANNESICNKYGMVYEFKNISKREENGHQIASAYSIYACHVFTKKVSNNIEISLLCDSDSQTYSFQTAIVNFYDNHNTKYADFVYSSAFKFQYDYSMIGVSIKYDENDHLIEHLMLGYSRKNIPCSVLGSHKYDLGIDKYLSWSKKYENDKLIDYIIYGDTIYNLRYYSATEAVRYTYDGNNLIEKKYYSASTNCIYDHSESTSFNNIIKYTYDGDKVKSSRYFNSSSDTSPMWENENTIDYVYDETGRLSEEKGYKSETESYTKYTYEYGNDRTKKIYQTDSGCYDILYKDGNYDVIDKYRTYTNGDTNYEYIHTNEKYLNGILISDNHYNWDSTNSISYLSFEREYMEDGSGRQTKYIGYNHNNTDTFISSETRYHLGEDYYYKSYNSDGTVSSFREYFLGTTSTKNSENYYNGKLSNKHWRTKPWHQDSYEEYDSNGNINYSTIYNYDENDFITTKDYVYLSDSGGYKEISEYDPYKHKSYYRISYKKYSSRDTIDYTNSETLDRKYFYLLRKNGNIFSYATTVTRYTADGSPYIYNKAELAYDNESDAMITLSSKYYDENGNFMPISTLDNRCSTEYYVDSNGTGYTKYYEKLSDGTYGRYFYVNDSSVTNKYGYIESRYYVYHEDIDGNITSRTIAWYNSKDSKYDNNGRLLSARYYQSDGSINWSRSLDYKYDKFGNTINIKQYNSNGDIAYSSCKDYEYYAYNIKKKETTYSSNGDISHIYLYDYDIINGQYTLAMKSDIVSGKKVFTTGNSQMFTLTEQAKKDLNMKYINLWNITIYDSDGSIGEKLGFDKNEPYIIEHQNSKLTIYFKHAKSGGNRWLSERMILEYIDINGDVMKIDYDRSANLVSSNKPINQTITRTKSTKQESRYYSSDTTIDWTNDKTYDEVIENGVLNNYHYTSETNRILYNGLIKSQKSDTLIEQRLYQNGNILYDNKNTYDIYTTVDNNELYRINIQS